MELKILDIDGNDTDKRIIFDDNLFFKKSYYHLVHLELKRYLFAQRHGNSKTKERSDITGSTRKLYRQKGTGNARKGDIKNPIFRGGGRVFGPKPKKYSIKVNKNTRKIVKKFLIEKKLSKNKIIIIEKFQIEKPKTKIVLKILKSLNLSNKKSLLVIEKFDKNLYLSFRNLKLHRIICINELDCFMLLNYSYIILTNISINKFQNYLCIK
ncbi:50S ribosomal protein L4 [Blattabacterium cuenoti]|uniref:50S ribosomal protein L4 n=1 Tax=Blattabacterium cuenoti TaxID=1653831 RepID=UPI00163B7FB9|nr:50S ribosomal protein L4 [Blattabacterium cuenoti]